MAKLLIIVGSVRPGRVGLPIAQWVREAAQSSGGLDVDFADLKEIALPFMDEPQYPAKRAYEHEHTLAWSARVDSAEAFIFVSPEYNHSYSPALKNAIDYLAKEWQHKPVGYVSYGGASAGTRGVAALDVVAVAVGLVKVAAAVEISSPANYVNDGVFSPSEKHGVLLTRMFSELIAASAALRVLR
ncbi:MAG: NAD(P)H-dependent oxidoreductase [Salinibacterium sp.]|nr:NAD(P)H-dependent oxidoreductase [Salinibacterium sp.]